MPGREYFSRMRAFSLILFLATATSLRLGAATPATLLPPEARWISGETVTLETLAREGGAPPEVLALQITNARGANQRLKAQRVAVEGNLIRYRLTIPEAMVGRSLVKLETESRAPYVVEILPRGTPADLAAAPANYEPSADAALPAAPPPVEFTWVDRFYTHEPLYFVAGATSDSDAKFQLSFKYQIYSRNSGLPKRLADGWLAPDGLYATYTQSSLWDIAENSSPFRDTSYKPGLYWQARDVWYRENEQGRARLSLLTGVEHESNGRAGLDSRSMNLFVVRPSLSYVTSGKWRFLISPKFYAYLEKTDNEDLPDYRGYVDLHALVRLPSDHANGGLQLALTGRVGAKSGRTSLQVDLTYPIRWFNVPGYLAAQVFDGYGEALLHYREKGETQYRLGFAAIR